ncbi:MAG: 4-hydroxy-tetrahydrodipicolinate synthase [Methanomicrobiales archaeon]|jgi:4-hydroxy-tetrahydrodipicolinate synthase|nr:4-hydroxy-tetrahydrodipicolinate synthase [Methanomicrobiales archaeon]
MIEGIIPALITPFSSTTRDLDLDGLRSNIEAVITAGVHGIVPCGSTGEAATLDFEEHEKVVETAVDCANGRVPVIAGTGSNNTKEALRFTNAAKDCGADAVLVISPYYNKPNRSGLIKHFTAIADCDIPVILYNVPSRTGQNVLPDVVAELAKHPSVIGIKEASGDINQISRVLETTQDEDFVVLSGDDAMLLPLMALGGAGVISVAANIVPEQMVALYTALKNENYAAAREIHYKLSPIFSAMFIESNPIPVKYVAGKLGYAAGPTRLPLDEASAATRAQIDKVI